MGTVKEEVVECGVEEFDAEEFDAEECAISSELEEIVSAIAEEETLEECVAFEMIGEDT